MCAAWASLLGAAVNAGLDAQGEAIAQRVDLGDATSKACGGTMFATLFVAASACLTGATG